MFRVLCAIFVAILVKVIQDTHYIILKQMDLNPLLYIASSLQPFGFACSSLLLAFKADSIGHKKIIVINLIALIFGLFGIIYIQTFFLLALTRFITGFALGSINCSAYPYIKSIVSNQYLPFVMSCTYFALFSGAALAPALSKKILNNYTWEYWIYFLVIYTVIALLIFIFLKEANKSADIRFSDIKILFKNFQFIRCCLLGIFTIGHTYALQAINAQFMPEPVNVQISGRALMIIATIIMMFIRIYIKNCQVPIILLDFMLWF